MTEKQA